MRQLLSLLMCLLLVVPADAVTLLKQSTAKTVKLGPFVDETDGVTAETGLTIAQADIRLSKNGGAFAQTNNATGATHDENGWYGVPLDTTDTATLGPLTVAIHEAGALPVYRDYMVVQENVYDTFSASANFQVDAVAISGSTTAADNTEAAALNYSAERGLAGTALPAAAADAAGGLPISDAGGLDLDLRLDAAVSSRSAPGDQMNLVDDLNDTAVAEIASLIHGVTTTIKIATSDNAKTIVEGASAGTLCLLEPGTHDIGNNSITIPDNVAVRGAGRDVTEISSDITSAPIVIPGDNCLLEHLTIATTNASGGVATFDKPIGITSGSFTNSVFRHLRIKGHTDCVLISSSTACSGYFEDVQMSSIYDGFLLSGGAHVMHAKDISIEITEANAAEQVFGISLTSGSTLVGTGVDVNITTASGSDDFRGIYTNASTAVLLNSTITLNGTAAGTTHDAVNMDSGTVTLVNCDFDRNRTTIASGTFTDKGVSRDTIDILADTGTDGVLVSDGSGTGQINTSGGVVQADVRQYGGSTQSGNDAKDFFDAGYDPSTNQVIGVRDSRAGQLTTTINGTPAQQDVIVLTAGSPDNDAYNGWQFVCIDASAANQVAFGSVLDYVASTKTITLQSDPGLFTMSSGDIVVLTPASDSGFSVTDRDTINNIRNEQFTDDDWFANTLSQLATEAAVKAQADAALADIGLDHLIALAATGTDVADDSIIAKLVSKSATADFDDFVNTEDSLQAQRDNLGTAGANLTGIGWDPDWDAEVQSEVDDALRAVHLHHLFETDYDPDSKPGVATALLNEMVESDSGVSRFTTNTLENAAAAALDQQTIRDSFTIQSTGGDPPIDDQLEGILKAARTR